MNAASRWMLSTAIAILAVARSSFANPAVVQEVQQKVDAKQYAEALRQITSALGEIKPNDDTPDRYRLLMLRGESLLQTGQRTLAFKAFDMAEHCAPGAREAALARAHVVLLKASSVNTYEPKTAGGKPIDILNPESRKQAFAACREDLAKKLQPQLDAAMQAKSLTPMLDVLQPLLDLGYLEYASKGSAEETRAQLQDLGTQARQLINTELRRIKHQINAWEVAANVSTDDSRRGLYSNEASAARLELNYLQRIESTARDARRRAQDLGLDGSVWEPIIAESGDLADRLSALLNINN